MFKNELECNTDEDERGVHNVVSENKVAAKVNNLDPNKYVVSLVNARPIYVQVFYKKDSFVSLVERTIAMKNAGIESY